MTEKKRSAYQREMDEIHLSREKADETLRMMLEENRRLRIKEAERGEKRRISRWIPAAGAAAAAALLLAVGLNMNSAGYRFDQISVEAITATSAQKTEMVQQTEGPIAADPETLFPGWNITGGTADEFVQGGTTLHETMVFLEKGKQELNAAITDFEPAAYSAVQGEQRIAGKEVRLAYDTKSGNRIAVYRQDGMYIALYAQMEEKEFTEAVKSILEQNR